MNNKPTLQLSDVKVIAAAAESVALKNNWNVAIAVVDDGGHLLWLQRHDGTAPIASQIAAAKANTAALGRRDSLSYEQTINGGRAAFLSVPGLQGMLEGGIAIMHEGKCLGAVGVSGVLAAQDAEVARAGAHALVT